MRTVANMCGNQMKGQSRFRNNMETGNEIRSAAKNIRYYAEQIHKFVKQQFNRDCDIGQITGMNPEPGSVRFECLGCIDSASNWINLYCENIEANVQRAEKQDDKLRPPLEESEEEGSLRHTERTVTPEEFR